MAAFVTAFPAVASVDSAADRSAAEADAVLATLPDSRDFDGVVCATLFGGATVVRAAGLAGVDPAVDFSESFAGFLAGTAALGRAAGVGTGRGAGAAGRLADAAASAFFVDAGFPDAALPRTVLPGTALPVDARVTGLAGVRAGDVLAGAGFAREAFAGVARAETFAVAARAEIFAVAARAVDVLAACALPERAEVLAGEALAGEAFAEDALAVEVFAVADFAFLPPACTAAGLATVPGFAFATTFGFAAARPAPALADVDRAAEVFALPDAAGTFALPEAAAFGAAFGLAALAFGALSFAPAVGDVFAEAVLPVGDGDFPAVFAVCAVTLRFAIRGIPTFGRMAPV